MSEDTMSTGPLKFEVGNTYTNRKGDFVVVSMSGSNMTIQWENGETVNTTTELQERIIANMEIEKRMMEGKPLKKKKATPSIKVNSNFVGLTDTDFSTKISGTTWRNKNCLGGHVTRKLITDDCNFNSHAVYRKPSIVFQNDDHLDKDKMQSQAKFFVQLDDNDLTCGYSVERLVQESDKKQDWDGFVIWLSIPENDVWLRSDAEKQSLTVNLEITMDNLTRTDTLTSTGESWLRESRGVEKEYSTLAEYLNLLSQETEISFKVVKTMSKNDVVEKGIGVVDDISSVFNHLMPIYSASVLPTEEDNDETVNE